MNYKVNTPSYRIPLASIYIFIAFGFDLQVTSILDSYYDKFSNVYRYINCGVVYVYLAESYLYVKPQSSFLLE